MGRFKKRKVWLTEPQVNRMLEIALGKGGEHDWLALELMRYGLRVGEIFGDKGLPGIHVEDLREKGIWVRGKGYTAGIVQDKLVPMKADLMERLHKFKPKKGRVFAVSVDTAQNRVKQYARLAGVEDWERISPHRLRAFFATDAKDKGKDGLIIKDLMRHKNLRTTEIYVGSSTPEQLSKVIETL